MLRKLAWIGVAAALGAFAAGCAPEQTDESSDEVPTVHAQGANGGATVTICHVPPGDPAAAHTITVSAASLKAHLAHGDNVGPCGNGGGDGGSGGGTGTGTGTGGSGGGTTTSTTTTTTTETTSSTTTETTSSTTTETTSSTTTETVTETTTSTTTTTVTVTETVTDTTTSTQVCSANGVGCSADAECCNGICGGSGQCGSQCTIGPELGGDFCSQDNDCCDGVCIAGACYTDMVCKLPGSPCDWFTDNCCFDQFCNDSGFCAPL